MFSAKKNLKQENENRKTPLNFFNGKFKIINNKI